MIKRQWIFIAAAVLGATVALSAGEDIRITPIASGKQVLVSFAVRDAWTMGTREVLQSGLMLRFEYEVALKKPAMLWFVDQELARVRITSRAQHDTLAGGYKVSRMRNDRIIKSDPQHARCVAGMVTWRSGDLQSEIDLDTWIVLEPDAELIMRKADGLWDELVRRWQQRSNSI